MVAISDRHICAIDNGSYSLRQGQTHMCDRQRELERETRTDIQGRQGEQQRATRR